MGRYRTEVIVLLVAGGLLTAMAGADVLTGSPGRGVVTGVGAIVSFVLALLVTWSDRRRPDRPGDGDGRE